MKIYQRRLIGLAITYVAITFPLAVMFVVNEPFRVLAVRTANHYAVRIFGCDTVFIGDSLTYDGQFNGLRSWKSVNLAVPGATTHQIRTQARFALHYRPSVVCVMAGTNDVLEANYDEEYTVGEYRKLLESIGGQKCIVVLVPFTSDPELSTRISSLNERLKEIAPNFVDLNPTISRDGKLLSEFTTDGIHFSPAGYRVWALEMRKSR